MRLRHFEILALAAAVFGGTAWAQDTSRRSNTRTQSQRNSLYNTSKSDTYGQRNSQAGAGNTGTGGGTAGTSGIGMSNTAPRLRGIQIAPAGMAVVGGNSQTPGGEAGGGTGPTRTNTRTQADRNDSLNTAYSESYGVRDNRINAGAGAGTPGAAPGVAGEMTGPINPGGTIVGGPNAYNPGYGVGGLNPGYGVGVPNTFAYLPGIGYAPAYATLLGAPGGTEVLGVAPAIGAGGAAGAPGAAGVGGGVGVPGGAGTVGPGGAAGAGPMIGGGAAASPPGGYFSPPDIGYRLLPEATPGPTRQAMANNPNWPPRPTHYMRSIPMEPTEAPASASATRGTVASPAATPLTGQSTPLSSRARAYQQLAPSEPTIVDNSLRLNSRGMFARDVSGRYGGQAGGGTEPTYAQQPTPRSAGTGVATAR